MKKAEVKFTYYELQTMYVTLSNHANWRLNTIGRVLRKLSRAMRILEAKEKK